jgi:hypothetical protein
MYSLYVSDAQTHAQIQIHAVEAQAKVDALVEDVAVSLQEKLNAYAAAFEKDPEAALAALGESGVNCNDCNDGSGGDDSGYIDLKTAKFL